MASVEPVIRRGPWEGPGKVGLLFFFRSRFNQDLTNQRRVRVKRGYPEAGRLPVWQFFSCLWLVSRSGTGRKRACQLRWFSPQPGLGCWACGLPRFFLVLGCSHKDLYSGFFLGGNRASSCNQRNKKSPFEKKNLETPAAGAPRGLDFF